MDDSSEDGGGEFLKSFVSLDGAVRLVELDRNYGQSTALYAGLQTARGEILVTLDADLQNPPEEIPRLVSFLEDCDLVAGIREPRRDSWFRKFRSRIVNRTRQKILGDTIEDMGCTLQVFRKEVLEGVYPFKGLHRFFPAIVEVSGFRVKQIAVSHSPRRRGRSKYPLYRQWLSPLWDLWGVHWLLKRKIKFDVKEDEPSKEKRAVLNKK